MEAKDTEIKELIECAKLPCGYPKVNQDCHYKVKRACPIWVTGQIAFKVGQLETAKELYEDVICPMCYRLNPQHNSADNGAGCKTCEDKEYYCGKSS